MYRMRIVCGWTVCLVHLQYLVAVFPAEFLEVVHVPHNIFHPWFSGGHTEAPMVPGQQTVKQNGSCDMSSIYTNGGVQPLEIPCV